MSIKRLPALEPPPPPPPPKMLDVLVCDGCGFEGLRMDPGVVTTLPEGWFRGWVGTRATASALVPTPGFRIDICPRCIPGSAFALPNGKRIPLEES